MLTSSASNGAHCAPAPAALPYLDHLPADPEEPADEAPWAEDDVPRMWGDAEIMTPGWNPDEDPLLAQETIVCLGAKKDSFHWKNATMPIGLVLAKFASHKEGAKDGPGFVGGEIAGERRVANAVKALYWVGLDVDTGMPSADIDAKLLEMGKLCVRATTHSHGKTTTAVAKSRVVKFAQDKGVDPDEIDTALCRAFVAEMEHYEPAIVETAEFVEVDHTEEGIKVVISHERMAKNRIIFPMLTPFVIADQAQVQRDAIEKWKKIPTALAQMLGVPMDRTGVDPSRLFYLPRHKKGAPYDITLFGGELFDWRTLDLQEDPYAAIAADMGKGAGGSKGKFKTKEGQELGRWSIKAAHGFQIADVVQDYASDRVRAKVSRGFEIECPFDEEHSNAGDLADRACMVVNAGDGPSPVFTVTCRHEGCIDKTNLDMLGKMLKDGWFPREVLDDERYNAAAPEEASNPVEAVKIAKEDKAAVEVEAARAAFLDELEGLTEDASLDDVRDLLRLLAQAQPDDIARDANIEAIKEHGPPTLKFPALQRIFKAEAATVAAVARRAMALAPTGNALKFEDEASLVKTLNEKIAIVRFRGQARIAFFDGIPDEPIEFYPVRDAEDLLAPYKLLSVGEMGQELEPKSGFSTWLSHYNRRSYKKVGFYPDLSRVPEHCLNFFTGFAAQPIPGCCERFKELWLSNICAGDPGLYTYTRRWLAWKLQRPADKIGVSILLRSNELGTGKDTFSEQIGAMIGEKYSPPINDVQKVLGQFAGFLEYALLPRLGEVSHPGDRKSVDKMKALITDRLMMVERKRVDAYQVANYCDFLMTSNNDWVVAAVGGERRFLFLDVAAHHAQDRDYFGAILDEMNNGGREALMHELMTLDITGFDREKPPMTSGLRQQIALGLSPEDKWLASWLTEGSLPFLDDSTAQDGVSDLDWGSDELTMAKETVLKSFRQHAPGHPQHPRDMSDLSRFLTKRLPSLKASSRVTPSRSTLLQKDGDGRVRVFKLPTIEGARARFLEVHAGYEFPASDDAAST